jgi:2-polyprenyl-3-methyl-5-hydroxy-6-metoxy-1,4-benzoquinol methylase
VTKQSGQAQFDNERFKQPSCVYYQSWLYAPYIKSLISYCGLKKGASILDAGCGQGFFSWLFSKNGMEVHGIDISETRIHEARKLYGHLGVTYSVSNIETAVFPEQFDCIFVRSCSLYNVPMFPHDNRRTNSLLKYLKPRGTFLFLYNSNFSSKISRNWRYHSLADVQQHFRGYPNARVFVLNRFTTYLLRRHSFNPHVTRFNAFLSKALGVGVDIVCVLQEG